MLASDVSNSRQVKTALWQWILKTLGWPQGQSHPKAQNPAMEALLKRRDATRSIRMQQAPQEETRRPSAAKNPIPKSTSPSQVTSAAPPKKRPSMPPPCRGRMHRLPLPADCWQPNAKSSKNHRMTRSRIERMMALTRTSRLKENHCLAYCKYGLILPAFCRCSQALPVDPSAP